MGSAKESIGSLFGNTSLQQEGREQSKEGQAQSAVGQATDWIQGSVDRLRGRYIYLVLIQANVALMLLRLLCLVMLMMRRETQIYMIREKLNSAALSSKFGVTELDRMARVDRWVLLSILMY
jgi:uncharacterized protein YjbJ (UPF0337 family)